LEKRGIPTATICSTEFVALGRAESSALGLAVLPIAIIQHPLGGLKPEAVQQRAHSVVDTVQQLLTTPRQQLKTAS
jgi:hypothetical protein